MAEVSRSLILGFVLISIFLSPLHAQVANTAPVDPNSALATSTPTQAPDDATKKLTELVHAGKYTEAQQLTTGLLVAYPNDQRLIKAKALIEKLLSPAASASATPGNNQLAANPNAEQLTGMDKVDYNALIQLARQAQQNADPAEQRKLLQQFMGQSNAFLQKHPDQILLWQLRAASAISLNDPMAGYKAGQKLIAAGAADSNDPNLEQLLAQLKNQGWLDKQEAEKAAKQAQYEQYDWILGEVQFGGSVTDMQGGVREASSGGARISFVKSGSMFEGLWAGKPFLEFAVLDSGAISCKLKGEESDRNSLRSCEIDSVKRTLKLVETGTDKYHYTWTTFLSK